MTTLTKIFVAFSLMSVVGAFAFADSPTTGETIPCKAVSGNRDNFNGQQTNTQQAQPATGTAAGAQGNNNNGH